VTTPAKRRPQARTLLADRYPEQVPAIVIERALMRMTAADARRERVDARRKGGAT
jgi:hypothetical protein